MAAVLDALGLINTVAGPGAVALIPGGLFELILPVWPLARGFRQVEAR